MSEQVKIKICGITSLEDAIGSCEAGADALGFVFCPNTPRFITREKARHIIDNLPPFVKTIGVFMDEKFEKIVETVDYVGLDGVQLHGDESPGFCKEIRNSVIKAFRVKDEGVIGEVIRYQVSAYLLDTYQKGVPGGTGIPFNWDLAIKAKRYGRIILAGGLTPENVRDAVERVHPYALDVSSGVEASKGKKDLGKVKRFIAMAREISPLGAN